MTVTIHSNYLCNCSKLICTCGNIFQNVTQLFPLIICLYDRFYTKLRRKHNFVKNIFVLNGYGESYTLQILNSESTWHLKPEWNTVINMQVMWEYKYFNLNCRSSKCFSPPSDDAHRDDVNGRCRTINIWSMQSMCTQAVSRHMNHIVVTRAHDRYEFNAIFLIHLFGSHKIEIIQSLSSD